MIYMDNRQDKIQITEEIRESVENIIKHALKEEEVNIPTQVSVIFIDNSEIKTINSEQRGIDKVTDVLSFPMLDYPEGKIYKEIYKEHEFKELDMDNGEVILGDIVLSLERAEEQSVEYGHSFIREVCYLTIHSVLHLLGYDHIVEEDKRKMRKREEKILTDFNITR